MVEGRDRVAPELVLAILDTEIGAPIHTFDPHRAQRELTALGWVERAEVARRMPGTIYVRLVEREPLAIWQQGGALALIDADGTVITRDGLEQFADLLQVVGPGAETAAYALSQELAHVPSLYGLVDAAVWVSSRRWDLVMSTGVRVRLPEGDIGPALMTLADMHRDYRILADDIVSIDLRVPDRMIVRLPGDPDSDDESAPASADTALDNDDA